MSAVPKLELAGVGKQFRTKRSTTTALQGIDLTISDGEFFSVIGRSGCGKTTLLRLAGLVGPSEGVFLGDRVVQRTPRQGRVSAIRRVGFARPRGVDVATEPEFGAIVRELRHALDGED